MTDSEEEKQNQSSNNKYFRLYDMLFPGAKVAKLCKIITEDPDMWDFDHIFSKFKIKEPHPVIVIAGGLFADRGKFYAGIARAAFKTDAVIIDSGLKTGIEPFVIRKDVKLIGVSPGNSIKFPKTNLLSREPYELSKGHSHIFLVYNGSKKEKTSWNEEADFKMQLAKMVLTNNNRKKFRGYKCKMVMILMGDNPKCLEEVSLAVEMKVPIIVVRGSTQSNSVINMLKNPGQDHEMMNDIIKKGDFHILEGKCNSEEIASYVHLLLNFSPTVRPGDVRKGNK